MSEIKAILLVPVEGDPLGLLADGVCGSRPPMAVPITYPRVVHEGNRFADPTVPCEVCKACDQPWPCDTPGKVESEGHVCWKPANRQWGAGYITVFDALVLAWDGKPVREGCYRAADALEIAPSAVPGAIECALDGDQMIRSISELGTLVLLDAEGKEVSDGSHLPR
jgi:hypothetical protein